MAEEEKEKETVPPDAPPADPPKTIETPAPADPPADNEGLRAELQDLKGIVTSLAETVAALAPLPGDETPTPKPWTHRTFG